MPAERQRECNEGASMRQNEEMQMRLVGPGITRRRFIVNSASGALSLLAAKRVVAYGGVGSLALQERAIRGVRVQAPVTIPHNMGGTWVAAWADDDNLYSPSNDTSGFHEFDLDTLLTPGEQKQRDSDPASFKFTADEKRQIANRCHSKIAFNCLKGSDPTTLDGETANWMPDYKMQDQVTERVWTTGAKQWEGADGRTWKSSGCTFVDGALYWVIARHQYGEISGDASLRQTAVNASIVKSTDYGMNWTRSAEENLKNPMFPWSHFSTPYFIDYGKDRLAADGAEQYIYAISNHGFWDNGDAMILGRVLRVRIGDLNSGDWEYFVGGDGLHDKSWARQAGAAKPIHQRPRQLGETGAVYLPDRKRYMMIGWYYPAGSGKIKGASKATIWDFYEAPKPWGPWTCIDSHTFSPQGYYCPGICPKFQSESRIYAITAGDFNNGWAYYRLTVVPIDLS
jgi:hypothetical protein